MLKRLDDFMAEIEADDTIGNDDEIMALYDQIRLRDAVICEMWKLLEQSVSDPDASFIRSEALERHRDFVKDLGTDYEPLEVPEPDFLEDDFITCEECRCWASETSENGHNVNCLTGLKLEETK